MENKSVSSMQEKSIAKALGGKVQSNSGGTKFGGGDVHTDTFFIEAKTPTTSKDSFSIKKVWIEKMKQQAYEQNKLYKALAFCFEPGGDNYYVIDEQLMKSLIFYMEGDI